MHREAYILPDDVISFISQLQVSESDGGLRKGHWIEDIEHIPFKFDLCVEYPINRFMIAPHEVFFRIVLNVNQRVMLRTLVQNAICVAWRLFFLVAESFHLIPQSSVGR